MLLETSFCGPKPVDSLVESGLLSSVEATTTEALEQMLLSRKHDSTQVVLAEGINIPTSDRQPSSQTRPKRQSKEIKNGSVVSSKVKQKTPEVKITKPQTALKTGTTVKPIVGKTKSGTEYFRIKLMPDHMYEDNGLGENEKVVELPVEEAARKPVTLSIRQDGQRLDEKKIEKSTSSPKPARHIFALGKDSGSRSPSPANVITSRKNSFCSLFKLKDTSAPDSPTALQVRKKSSASARENDEAHSHRSRSCGKIKDSDKLSPSQGSTPSKQKSVLGIFKTKKSGTKSKSSSPIDHEDKRLDSCSPVNPYYSALQPAASQQSKQRLKYYDQPLDGKSIHIPLHTPPDEKDLKGPNDDAIAIYNKMLDDQLHETELGRSILRNLQKEKEKPPVEAIVPAVKPVKKEEAKPKGPKTYRIENPDGSIRIPLRTPSDERDPETVCEVHVEKVPAVVESVPLAKEIEPEPEEMKPISNNDKPTIPPVPPISIPDPLEPLDIQHPDIAVPPPTPASATVLSAREKKHILFTTKIGSGSDEQLFQTQLSLSKTESLCSPSSDQAAIPESPIPENIVEHVQRLHKEVIILKDTKIDRQSSSDEKHEPVVEKRNTGAGQMCQGGAKAKRSSSSNSDRHSKLIENMEEIMEKQKRVHNLLQKEIENKEFSSSEDKPKIMEETVTISSDKRRTMSPNRNRSSVLSTDEHILSSESDKDSETTDTNRPKKHLPRNLAIDEHESTGLVSQISYEDELPYIPTTLPEERSVGLPIIPIKERVNMEVKTYPLERPRSTTPLNPAFLEDYCGGIEDNQLNQRGDKLKISLPRKDSREKIQKPKSPRRISNASGKSWFEFEQNLKDVDVRRNSETIEEPPPPLPPRGAAAPPPPPSSSSSSAQWVNFENIPEKRKPPKRITTVPHKEPPPTPPPHHDNTVYQYVKPDECQCECHEMERKVPDPSVLAEDAEPLLDQENGDTAEGAASMR